MITFTLCPAFTRVKSLDYILIFIMNVKKFVIMIITLMTIVIAWENMPRILASVGEQLYVQRNPT